MHHRQTSIVKLCTWRTSCKHRQRYGAYGRPAITKNCSNIAALPGTWPSRADRASQASPYVSVSNIKHGMHHTSQIVYMTHDSQLKDEQLCVASVCQHSMNRAHHDHTNCSARSSHSTIPHAPHSLLAGPLHQHTAPSAHPATTPGCIQCILHLDCKMERSSP
jgi:hypothetical protein